VRKWKGAGLFAVGSLPRLRASARDWASGRHRPVPGGAPVSRATATAGRRASHGCCRRARPAGPATGVASGAARQGQPRVLPSGAARQGQPRVLLSGATRQGQPGVLPSGATRQGQPGVCRRHGQAARWPSGTPGRAKPRVLPSARQAGPAAVCRRHASRPVAGAPIRRGGQDAPVVDDLAHNLGVATFQPRDRRRSSVRSRGPHRSQRCAIDFTARSSASRSATPSPPPRNFAGRYFHPRRRHARRRPFDLLGRPGSDDTSMALCLADSLLECNGFDARDQIERYRRCSRRAISPRPASASDHRQHRAGDRHSPVAPPALLRLARSQPGRPEPLSRVAPAVLFFFATSGQRSTRPEAARTTCQSPVVLEALPQSGPRALRRAVGAAKAVCWKGDNGRDERCWRFRCR